MFPVNSVKDVDDADAFRRCNFEWSFKPLAIWMKIFTGIRIDFREGGKWSVSRIGFILYSGLMVLANIFHFYNDASGFWVFLKSVANNENKQFLNETNLYLSGTARFGLVIEYLNLNVTKLFSHLWLFVVSLTVQWGVLWDDLKEIQQMNLPFTVYRNIRRKSWIVVIIVFLILVYKIWDLISKVQEMLNGKLSSFNGLDPTPMMQNILIIIMENVFWSHTVLFWITVNSASTVLGVLNQRVQSKADDDLTDLIGWKVQHDWVCKLIQSLNLCYGPYIFVAVCHGFVSFITYSYQSATLLTDNDLTAQNWGVAFLTRFFYEFAVLSILVYTCHRVQAEGVKLKASVCSFRPTLDTQRQTLLNGIVTQVTQSELKISASHFFDVNLSLYPTLIGSTLTYGIILFQFNPSNVQ